MSRKKRALRHKNNNQYQQPTQNPSLTSQLSAISQVREEMEIKERLLIEKALRSDNPTEIINANEVLKANFKKNKGGKSYLLDPMHMNDNLGYKDRPTSLSYGMLRGMAKEPIIKSIIGTRTEQVANFSEAQDDESKIGWTIKKKRKLFFKDLDGELSDTDKIEIENIIKFVENCGRKDRNYHADGNFDAFLRKITPDSLILDQSTFEIVTDKVFTPVEFFATDGSSHRLASSFNNDLVREDQEEINGYYPFYVQLYQGLVRAEYYPWELNFGIRNPNTSIYNYGYGESELETMIKIVTWMLYSDSYNGKFFSQGSNPKGILAIKGQVDEDKLNEFRSQWRQTVAGIDNAHRVPVIQSDEIEWLDLQKSNKDMEFGAWKEYLIRLSCAIYKIAPEEIGFHINSNQGGTTYEGNQEYKLEYSQDKGLKPLLKSISSWINKKIIAPLTGGKYEFCWTGLGEDNGVTELDNDIKKLGGFMGLKEIRKKNNLPEDLDPNDILLNPVWVQLQQMKMMGSQQSNEAMGDEPMTDNPFKMMGVDDVRKNNPFQFNNDGNSGIDDGSDGNKSSKDNPFMKDLSDFMDNSILQK